MMAAESLWEWTRQHPWRAVLGFLAFAAISAWIAVVAQAARADRNWVEHLAVMPAIEMRADGFALGPATDWTYDADGPTREEHGEFRRRLMPTCAMSGSWSSRSRGSPMRRIPWSCSSSRMIALSA